MWVEAAHHIGDPQSTDTRTMETLPSHKELSRFPWRNISNLRHADDTTLMAENEEELSAEELMLLNCGVAEDP